MPVSREAYPREFIPIEPNLHSKKLDVLCDDQVLGGEEAWNLKFQSPWPKWSDKRYVLMQLLFDDASILCPGIPL
jgi:hypothetical protein